MKPKTKGKGTKKQTNSHKVVAIISTHNGVTRGYIKDAINSVLALGYDCCVVDDGSNDDTYSILKKKYGRKIRLFRKENGGCPSGFNYALRRISGDYDYFCPMGDDDILLPRESAIEHMRKHPNVGMVHGNAHLIDHAGKGLIDSRNGKPVDYKPPQDWLALMEERQTIHGITTTIQMRLMERIGFYDADFLMSEDYDLFFRIMAVAKVDYVDDFYCKYRVHGANKGERQNDEMLYYKCIDMAKSKRNNVNRTIPLSVLSFVKDEEMFIGHMIDSVIDYVDEIVIVDTGSTDDTIRIIKSFKSDKVKLHFYPCDHDNLSDAINYGINRIKNEWILIVAGDEVFNEAEIAKIPDLLRKLQDTKVDIVRIAYNDFIGDFQTCYAKTFENWVYRIWRNINGFHFEGEYQGNIRMCYDSGIQTSGYTEKANIPDAITLERTDIKFNHYARCKPKKVLLEKRITFYEKRWMKLTEEQVIKYAKKDPWHTLKLETKPYEGEQPRSFVYGYRRKVGYDNQRYWESRARDYIARHPVTETPSDLVMIRDYIGLLEPLPKTVIDVGCGVGRYFPVFGKAKITAVDISKSMVAECKRRHPHNKYIVSSIKDLGNLKIRRKFDLAFSCTALEHVPPHKIDETVEVLTRLANRIIVIEPFAIKGFFVDYCFSYMYPELFRKFGYGLKDMRHLYGDTNLYLFERDAK